MVHHQAKTLKQAFMSSPLMILGTFLVAVALEVFLIPNHIIDGGVVGISILIGDILGDQWLYPSVIILNIPFLILGFKNVGKSLVIQMFAANIFFVFFGLWIGGSQNTLFTPYRGDLLEIVVIGGLTLGLGVGLIIRWGGCLDGTEILGILINKKYGFSVGSIVLATNVVIFTIAGFVFGEWHPPIQSLITFFIVIKIMDMVIMGLDEMKTVLIITVQPQQVAKALMHELGLGLTIIHGKGGYTGEPREILFLIAERLQLVEIKALVHSQDPGAFIAIDNLHEVASQSRERVTTKTNRGKNHSPSTPR